jgi:hypothetical protein
MATEMSLGSTMTRAEDLLVVGANAYSPCDSDGALGECCRPDRQCQAGLRCDDAFDYPVCTVACDGANPCDAGAECMSVELGEESRDMCLLVCDAETPCPDTMECIAADDTLSICRPNPMAPGALFVWTLGSPESLAETPQMVSGPEGMLGAGFGGSVAYVPDYFDPGEGALLAGMKYADGGGAVAVYPMKADGSGFEDALPELLRSPTNTVYDSFGGHIAFLGDIDGDGLGDFFVAIEGHVVGDPYDGGVQTGGVVFYH